MLKKEKRQEQLSRCTLKIYEKKNVKINPFPEKKCIKFLYICNVSGGIGNAMRR